MTEAELYARAVAIPNSCRANCVYQPCHSCNEFCGYCATCDKVLDHYDIMHTDGWHCVECWAKLQKAKQ
jgi:hypothetical protein